MLHWDWGRRFSGFTLAERWRSACGGEARCDQSTSDWGPPTPPRPTRASRNCRFVFSWGRESRSLQDHLRNPHRCQLNPLRPRTRCLPSGRYWIWKGVLVRCSSYYWSIGWFRQMKKTFSPEDCSTWHFDIRPLQVCVNIEALLPI